MASKQQPVNITLHIDKLIDKLEVNIRGAEIDMQADKVQIDEAAKQVISSILTKVQEGINTTHV